MEREELKQKVAQSLEQDSALLPASIAEALGVSEHDVVRSLPEGMATMIGGEFAQELLEGLVGWGTVTTIVHSMGSIFEVKAPFPKGKMARGYYNLMGDKGEMHGHLKLDLVKSIALVSKPFRGKESHYFGFFTEQGDSIFKIYLGRDENRELLPDQLEKFNALKKQYV
ncbi:heme utilization cystosolic carrier protein HutX [Vibrio sp. S9_S30]|uniref:heme utilization cystosolic carrier protein HutX n=1 Tax=Vibrio sp. S9_S30 TaxID=2720226 RepID=UPI0016813193|nr:heme utilization cystosolic carrier protein HutX [Vibrio sp. S9_S30]MBD1557946.1 heme utilization cystosolic carrier protein HutX [Vibrio sp. S9_S30]